MIPVCERCVCVTWRSEPSHGSGDLTQGQHVTCPAISLALSFLIENDFYHHLPAYDLDKLLSAYHNHHKPELSLLGWAEAHLLKIQSLVPSVSSCNPFFLALFRFVFFLAILFVCFLLCLLFEPGSPYVALALNSQSFCLNFSCTPHPLPSQYRCSSVFSDTIWLHVQLIIVTLNFSAVVFPTQPHCELFRESSFLSFSTLQVR